MKLLIFALLLLAGGCASKLSVEDRALLERDEANKKLELTYLHEIEIAEENRDNEAFEYYLGEYIKVERLKLPQHLKDHPDYFQGGLNHKY